MKTVLHFIVYNLIIIFYSVNFLTAANYQNKLTDYKINSITSFSLEKIDFMSFYVPCQNKLIYCLEKNLYLLNKNFDLSLIDFRILCSDNILPTNLDIIYFHNFDLSQMNFDKDNKTDIVSKEENNDNYVNSIKYKSYIINIKPNPASNNAILFFNLESSGPLTVRLFSEIAISYPVIVDEQYQKGINSINLNLIDIPNGIYIVQIIIGNEIFTEKLIVAK
jgi:hypothetical protein